jgi:transposase
MERIPQGKYSPEFRAEAVKLVETEGLSVERAAKRLSLPKSSLFNWVSAARKGKLADVGKGQRIPTELELELSRMRKELAEVKMERDLLKKFATYFARESR